MNTMNTMIRLIRFIVPCLVLVSAFTIFAHTAYTEPVNQCHEAFEQCVDDCFDFGNPMYGCCIRCSDVCILRVMECETGKDCFFDSNGDPVCLDHQIMLGVDRINPIRPRKPQ